MRKLATGLQVPLGVAFAGSALPKLVGARDAMRDHLEIAPSFWAVTALAELVGAAGMLAAPAGLWVAGLTVGALGAHQRVEDAVANMGSSRGLPGAVVGDHRGALGRIRVRRA